MLGPVQTSAPGNVQSFTLSDLSVFTDYNITVYGVYISNDREESVPLPVKTERKLFSGIGVVFHVFPPPPPHPTPAGVPNAPVISVNAKDYLTWPVFRTNIENDVITQYRLDISA